MHNYHWLFYDDVALQRQNRERAQLRPFSLFCTSLTQVTINDDSICFEVSNLENAILIVNNLKIETSKKEELIKRLKDLNVINNKLKYVDLSQEMELKLEKKSLYKNKRLL